MTVIGDGTARSIAGKPPIDTPRAVPIVDLPLIPQKRRWLHGNDLMRGAVSMIVAPGARAKTTWLLTCALACASGRPLLGANVYGGPVSVLYLSAEDSTNEIALPATAILDRLLHHSHVITIRGDSYRLKEKRRSGLLQKPAAAEPKAEKRA